MAGVRPHPWIRGTGHLHTARHTDTARWTKVGFNWNKLITNFISFCFSLFSLFKKIFVFCTHLFIAFGNSSPPFSLLPSPSSPLPPSLSLLPQLRYNPDHYSSNIGPGSSENLHSHPDFSYQQCGHQCHSGHAEPRCIPIWQPLRGNLLPGEQPNPAHRLRARGDCQHLLPHPGPYRHRHRLCNGDICRGWQCPCSERLSNGWVGHLPAWVLSGPDIDGCAA